MEWFKSEKNVIELAEFMVESKQIDTAKELLEYIKNPRQYTKVWEIYQEEILGKRIQSHSNNVIPVMIALTNAKR